MGKWHVIIFELNQHKRFYLAAIGSEMHTETHRNLHTLPVIMGPSDV